MHSSAELCATWHSCRLRAVAAAAALTLPICFRYAGDIVADADADKIRHAAMMMPRH